MALNYIGKKQIQVFYVATLIGLFSRRILASFEFEFVIALCRCVYMMAQRCIIYNFFNSHFLIENTIWFSFGGGKFRARTKFKASSICINVFYNGHKNYLLDTHGISYYIGELIMKRLAILILKYLK